MAGVSMIVRRSERQECLGRPNGRTTLQPGSKLHGEGNNMADVHDVTQFLSPRQNQSGFLLHMHTEWRVCQASCWEASVLQKKRK